MRVAQPAGPPPGIAQAGRLVRRHEAKDIFDALESRTLLRWITLKSVSGYYPYLSPVVTQWLENKKLSVSDYFGHATSIYGSGITPAAREFFQREFGYEYDTAPSK